MTRHLMARCAGASVIALGATAGAQTPTFKVAVEAVYADVTVRHEGKPVEGLTSADFELKDDGVRQRAELVDSASLPLLAVLVFDTSRSTAGEKLVALRESGEAFLDGLRPGDRATLLTFTEQVAWPVPPTGDKAAVVAALARLRADGTTSMLDALYAGITVAQSGPRSLVVLFSDGIDNMSWLDAGQVELLARRSKAFVHVVGWKDEHAEQGALEAIFGEPMHVLTLRRIAWATGGQFWPADSPARLRQAFSEITESLAHRYLLRYEPTGVKREGWHRIEVRVRASKGDVQARPGYWIPPERATGP